MQRVQSFRKNLFSSRLKRCNVADPKQIHCTYTFNWMILYQKAWETAKGFEFHWQLVECFDEYFMSFTSFCLSYYLWFCVYWYIKHKTKIVNISWNFLWILLNFGFKPRLYVFNEKNFSEKWQTCKEMNELLNQPLNTLVNILALLRCDLSET